MSVMFRSELSLSMIVDDVVFDVVQFGADFSINSIPSASVVLAIGRKASDGTTAAQVHKDLALLKKDKTIKVFLCAKGEAAENSEWPDAPQLIFEGYVANVGFSKLNGKVNCVVSLTHWLSELNDSSAVSSLSHPSNPAEYTFSSILSSDIKGGTGPDKPAGLFATSIGVDITPDDIQEDLWSKALKPILCKLGNNETTRLDADLKDCIGVEGNDNSAVLRVLSRIEGDSESCGLALSCYTPRMAISDLFGEAPATVADSISEAIGSDTVESFANQTLWAKLIAYSGTYGGVIVPQVDKALFVPFVPGIRETYCKTIQTCDYSYIQLDEPISQLLKGIVIMTNEQFSAGSAPTADRQVASMVGTGGCYVPDPEARGMVRFIPPPLWLNNIPYAAHEAKRSVGMGAKKPFSSATTPQAENDPELIANKDGLNRTEIVKETSSLYDAWAQYQYALDSLRGRFGMISGKLRFDIAPGSNVVIAGSAEQFLQENDAIAQNMVGSVMRVSIGINAESQSAGTTLTLSHIRTLEENKDDKYSVLGHPLYKQSFIGAPLVDALWFPTSDCCGG